MIRSIYYIIPAEDCIHFDSGQTAVEEARFLANEEGRAFFVFSAMSVVTIHPPTEGPPVPEHVRNGVIPGVDFPATL